MEKQIASLVSISDKCKTAARQFKEQGFDQQLSLLDDVIRKVERASANSWLGYQANIYYYNFEPPKPGDHFSKEWGFQGSSLVNPVSQNWREYAPEDVKQHIMTAARFSEKTKLIDVATETENLFDKLKDELVIILTVTLEETRSEVVEGYRDDAKILKSHFSSQSLLEAAQPNGQFMSRDSLAMSQGFVAPPYWGEMLGIFFKNIFLSN